MENITSLINSASDSLAQLILIAAIVERITQFTKESIQTYFKKEMPPVCKELISLVLSIGICIVANIKLFNSNTINIYIDMIFAGIIASFGSIFLHSFSSLLTSLKHNNEKLK